MKKVVNETRPVLLIFHESCSTGGVIPRLLGEKNIPMRVSRPRFGEPLPSIEQVRSVIFFGGSVSANDTHEWLNKERQWMSKAIEAQLPLFGICLGAQLLAHHFGSDVSRLKENHLECGYYPIQSESILCSETPISHVYHWHREQFTLPKDATCLASGSDICPIQAFSYENTLGVQFHPEVDKASIERWHRRDAADFQAPNARPPSSHQADHDSFKFPVRAWLSEKIIPWLSMEKI